ncbi:MAG: AAA family ATPase [Gammaproteobacteria bacterium RIFCSPLOWO2_02_FULL_61_13]|nr:MAG: AAA family ATPase [Gammaproteobacteria bacterium RIFCSPLOWO2_02_FULL_61_13]
MATASSTLIPRLSAQRVTVALKDTPVVMLTGPRQSGKTTLVREFAGKDRPYFTLDDDTVLAGVRADPAGFLRDLDRAVIDEAQRAPDLLRAIKHSVDDDRRPGRFLLTGSANVLVLPAISESLAGRMESVSLLPLSQVEISGNEPSFLKKAFAGRIAAPKQALIGAELVNAVLTGGYPEMLQRKELSRRQTWAREYLKALLQRDVRDIADVEKLDGMARLFRTLAHHSGGLVNFAQAGGRIGLDEKTARKYVTIFEQLFIVRRLEPWLRNRQKRLVKTPKLHFLDSGLLAATLGATIPRIAKDRAIVGSLLEAFVFSEILKQVEWFDEACALHHFRDKDQNEVDIVVEGEDGVVVGVEVKAAATVGSGDFKGLRKLADACGNEFKLGVVLYDGDQIVPFGARMFAAPIPCLWS